MNPYPALVMLVPSFFNVLLTNRPATFERESLGERFVNASYLAVTSPMSVGKSAFPLIRENPLL